MVRDDEGRRPPGDAQSSVRAASEYIGHGMTFALSAILFFLAGDWLDGKLGTGPVLALLGLLIGSGVGFWRLYAQVTAIRDRTTENETERERRQGGPGPDA